MLDNYSRVRLMTDRYKLQGASWFDVGYIIEVYPENKYEVEFSNPDGITTAQIAAGGDELQEAAETSPALRCPMPMNQIEEHKK